MRPSILEVIETSDVTGAVEIFENEISGGGDPWDIHLSLFPSVQRVLNPPFINPHLPKMYAICREFEPRIDIEDLRTLVGLEITEYAKRPKLKAVDRGEKRAGTIAFDEIESALAGSDPRETARLMASFWANKGGVELARRMLLLGSGYLGKSLGHSISCTAFILLEAIERVDQDPWPALVMLADYFHKGRFSSALPLKLEPVPEEEMNHHLLRAASGRGIINLHHTITIYAVDRVRHLFSDEEYNHLVRAWIDFMGDKEVEEIPADDDQAGPPINYSAFEGVFSALDTGATFAMLCKMLHSEDELSRIGRYLIKGVCNQYQGNYNPHYLTGLGSALWVLDTHAGRQQIVVNALHQYLDYFYSDLKS